MVGSSGVWRDLRDVTLVWDGEDVDEQVKCIDMEWWKYLRYSNEHMSTMTLPFYFSSFGTVC